MGSNNSVMLSNLFAPYLGYACNQPFLDTSTTQLHYLGTVCSLRDPAEIISNYTQQHTKFIHLFLYTVFAKCISNNFMKQQQVIIGMILCECKKRISYA